MAQALIDEPKTESLAVESGGRRHSPELRDESGSAAIDIRKLLENPEDIKLPGWLVEALWDRLAWNSIPPETTDRASLVQAYSDSLNQIVQFRKDVERMIRYACLANLEFRQARGETNVKARDQALDAKLNEMLDEAASHWPIVENVLEVELVSKRETTLRDRLHQSLAEAVAEFSSHFFELLARLVDRRMFGLVEWHPKHCCRYHFFKRVVVQEFDGTTQRVTETRFDDILDTDPAFWNRVIGRRTTEETQRGKHYHLFARHEHSVISAVRTSIANSQVVMPLAVVELVQQIPEWLRPFVTVIDGTIFREKIVEKEVGVDDFTQVTVRDEPIYGCEPAVIIGRYVLTGWGPRKVQQELDRRELVDREASVKRTQQANPLLASVFALASTVLVFIALFFFGRAVSGAGGGFLALVTAAAAIVAIWQAAYDLARVRKDPTPELVAHWGAGGVACAMLCTGWCIARWFLPVSWLPLFIFGAGFFVCLSQLRRFF